MKRVKIDEVSAVTGIGADKIEDCAQMIASGSKKVVAVYNIESRLDRAKNDLKALASLLLITGKIGAEGSGLILLSNQCNNRGMELVGFDAQLAPGGNLLSPDTVALLSRVWNNGLDCIKNGSSKALSEHLTSGTIKGGFIFGENPAIDPAIARQLEKLEFLVVADLFMTETAAMADVVLPLSSYVEDEGTMTNWEGRRQSLYPIGKSTTGISNLELIAQIRKIAGVNGDSAEVTFASLTQEMSQFMSPPEETPTVGALYVERFPTNDGKAHLEIYSADVSVAEPKNYDLLSFDERVNRKLSQLFG